MTTMATTAYIRLNGWFWGIFLVCSLLLKLVQLAGLELDSQKIIKWYLCTYSRYGMPLWTKMHLNICDRLCENPPCSHTNFDLFLEL